MDRSVTTTIDPELCIGCGACVKVCPNDTITMQNEKAVVTGQRSQSCGHCAAVCPTGAVRVGAIDPRFLAFRSFQADDRWLPHGQFPVTYLVRLMASRRSCRNYSERPVAREILEDLIRIGTTAPSGTNSQKWTFTVLPTRPAVSALGERISRFFEAPEPHGGKKMAAGGIEMGWPKGTGHLLPGHHESVETALEEYRRLGRDQLFHGAPALILVGSIPGGSCPAEDALLATQNILLAAHAMGLGTCLSGLP